jgi:hypothetical protein
MGKDSQKHLVGQPIFKQIIQMIPRDEFAVLVKKKGSDRYYKSFVFRLFELFCFSC